MYKALIRLFIPQAIHTDNKDEKRKIYGLFASTVGLVINSLLAVMKFVVGILSGSVAIVADAVNNLTDLASSTLSIISFKIAAKKPDEDHPFGHARIEYLLSSVLAMIILYLGGQFFIESFKKILNPGSINASLFTYIVLILSILAKLFLYFFYLHMSKEIDTVILTANAQDSLADVLSSSVILISVILSAQFGWQVDGYIGVIVAILILKAAYDILRRGADLIVGKKVSTREIEAIKRWIYEHQDVLGVHDLIIHDYGPGHRFASVHIEVDSRMSLVDAHDVIDYIENRAVKHLGLQLVTHIDPVDVANPEVQELKAKTENIVQRIHPDLSIHDFRIVQHKERKLIIFDCVIPSYENFKDRQLKETIQHELTKLDQSYVVKITFDRNYVRSRTH